MSVPSQYCPSSLDDDSSFSAAAASSSWKHLHSTAQEFLSTLLRQSNSAVISRAHPHCFLDPIEDVPPSGPLTDSFHHATFLDALVTTWCQVAPALLAMSELWLRLFAAAIAPLAIAHLLKEEITPVCAKYSLFSVLHQKSEKKEGKRVGKTDKEGKPQEQKMRIVALSSISGLASSAVLLTDSLYVHEYGRSYGATLFAIMTILSVRVCIRYKQTLILCTCIIPLLIVTALLVWNSGGVALSRYSFWGWWKSNDNRNNPPHPGIDLPAIKEGLYYSAANPTMVSIAKQWPSETRTYGIETGATPWLPTGDSRTGIPFLVNRIPQQQYERLWVQNPNDDEVVALDIAFPLSSSSSSSSSSSPTTTLRGHSTTKPVYLILHGLNGGSNEEYVKELVMRRTREGHTVIVMIARGLMDLPVRGWNVFHGARITDVDTVAKIVRQSLAPDQILAGVRFSMGAIVLANYVARSGPNCHLHAAIAVSGGLDMREQLNFYRSMRLWQPMLAKELRDEFILGKFSGRYKERLTNDEFLSLMRAPSISEVDLHGVVTYNGFNDLTHYYSEMSAMGDQPNDVFHPSNSTNTTNSSSSGVIDNDTALRPNFGERISNVSIPFCVLHALDDPLVTWRTVGRGDPNDLVESGSGHVMLLLTKAGGHVGWPLGLNPKVEGWKWMNNAVRDFINSADKVLMSRESKKN